MDDVQPAESKERTKDDTRTTNLLARRGVLALLGASGLGIIGNQSAAAQAERPLNQDVDVQGNTLSNIGSLSLTKNQNDIADFEGENLSIDNGVLNAEIPNSGTWESGEQILLASYSWNPTQSQTRTDAYLSVTRAIIPFEDLSYSNISQIYLSVNGIVRGDGGDTAGIRLYDACADTVLEETQVEETISEGSEVLLTGPKVAYNPKETTIMKVQASLLHNWLDTVCIYVWGEVE